MEENLDEILSEEKSEGAPLPSGDEAYLVSIIFTIVQIILIMRQLL